MTDIFRPELLDYTYIIKSGKVLIEIPDTYRQIPPCYHEYEVTSSNITIKSDNNTKLRDNVIRFKHDNKTEKFIWTIDTNDESYEGQYLIWLNYNITDLN